MTLAVHQPNFLPWVGFFAKMAASDVFVLLDTVQFPRGKSVGNRAKVKGPNGTTDLLVPLSIPKGHEGKVPYDEVRIAEGKWRKKLLGTLEMGYKKAPFFREYFPFIREYIELEDFTGMNIAFIRYMRDRLDLDTELPLLSDLEGIDEDKQGRIIELCAHYGADRYLSGQGAKKYNDPELFSRNGIDLAYTSFDGISDPVLKEAFEGGLSIIDPLFRIGEEELGQRLREMGAEEG